MEHVDAFTLDGRFRVMQLREAIISRHLRPTIPSTTPPLFRMVIERCWRLLPESRPLASEVARLMFCLLHGEDDPQQFTIASSSLAPSKSQSKYVQRSQSANARVAASPLKFRRLYEQSLEAETAIATSPVCNNTFWLALRENDRHSAACYRIAVGKQHTFTRVTTVEVEPPQCTAITAIVQWPAECIVVGFDDGSLYHYRERRCVPLLSAKQRSSISCLCTVDGPAPLLVVADARGLVSIWQWTGSEAVLVDERSLGLAIHSSCRVGQNIWLGSIATLLRLNIAVDGQSVTVKQLSPICLILAEFVIAMAPVQSDRAVWCLSNKNLITIFSAEGRLLDTVGPLASPATTLTSINQDRVITGGPRNATIWDAENLCALQEIDTMGTSIAAFLPDQAHSLLAVIHSGSLAVFAQMAVKQSTQFLRLPSIDLSESSSSSSLSTPREQPDAGQQKHSWKTYTFTKPTWCCICKQFIWGVVSQGKRCKVCEAATHHTCAKQPSPCPLPVENLADRRNSTADLGSTSAPSSSSSSPSSSTSSTVKPAPPPSTPSPTSTYAATATVYHAWKSTTFKKPVWCVPCGGFIWGAFKQGNMCVACKQAAHFQCSKELSACETTEKSLAEWNKIAKSKGKE